MAGMEAFGALSMPMHEHGTWCATWFIYHPRAMRMLTLLCVLLSRHSEAALSLLQATLAAQLLRTGGWSIAPLSAAVVRMSIVRSQADVLKQVVYDLCSFHRLLGYPTGPEPGTMVATPPPLVRLSPARNLGWCTQGAPALLASLIDLPIRASAGKGLSMRR